MRDWELIEYTSNPIYGEYMNDCSMTSRTNRRLRSLRGKTVNEESQKERDAKEREKQTERKE